MAQMLVEHSPSIYFLLPIIRVHDAGIVSQRAQSLGPIETRIEYHQQTKPFENLRSSLLMFFLFSIALSLH